MKFNLPPKLMVFWVSPPHWMLIFYLHVFFYNLSLCMTNHNVPLLDGEPPFWAHIHRWKGKDFGRNTWVWSYMLLRTPFGNTVGIWGTTRECIGTFSRTWWEHIMNPKKEKSLPQTHHPPPPTPPKKVGGLWMHVALSHLLHAISIFKTISHHFWPRLMPRPEFWAHNVIHINYLGLHVKSNLIFTTPKIWYKKM